jgi:alpha-tubulin suppressor-like RCC1 family protein
MSHTCAIALGSVYCWGSNEHGQLGNDADSEQELRPVLVAGTERYVEMCAGDDHTCAMTDLGAVDCWGRNQRGQLGQENRTNLARPARVPLSAPAAVLACGFAHVCAVLSNNELWCWGENGEGALGQDDDYPGDGSVETVDELSPIRVTDAAYRSAGPGGGHTCAVRTDGSLWCTGRNSQYQLGPASSRIQERVMLRVGTNTDWLQVAAGLESTFILRQDRSLWVFGTNTAIESDEGLPLGVPGPNAPSPTRVGAGDWLAVATHSFHTCAIARDNEAWCWGRNIEGQLGPGDPPLVRQPTALGRKATSVDVGVFTTCLVDPAGTVFCTGKNDFGQLGTGNTERPFAFTEVPLGRTP